MVNDGHDKTIGDRLRVARRQRDLTQEQLAERAGLSVDLVRKLEQNQRATAQISSLVKLADALDIQVTVLLGQQGRLDRLANGPDSAGILGIRRALTAVGDLPGSFEDPTGGGQRPSLPDIKASVQRAWRHYWDGSLTDLSAFLPGLIVETRTATRELPALHQPGAYELLAETYQVAACAMVQLAQEDLAFLACERAAGAATRGDDALREAILWGTVSWLYLRQGRYADARHVAHTTADRIEPSLSKATRGELSVWGDLLLSSATAASRSRSYDDARDLVNLAGTAAHRLGQDGNEYQTVFGPSSVAFQSVAVAVTAEEPVRALELAPADPVSRHVPTTAAARHLLDVAQAQCQLERDADALATMERIYGLAPEWLKYQGLSATIVQTLDAPGRRGVSRPKLRRLADHLGIEI